MTYLRGAHDCTNILAAATELVSEENREIFKRILTCFTLLTSAAAVGMQIYSIIKEKEKRHVERNNVESGGRFTNDV